MSIGHWDKASGKEISQPPKSFTPPIASYNKPRATPHPTPAGLEKK